MLKINKEHKKIDTTSIKKDNVKVKRIVGSGIILTISIFALKYKLPTYVSDYKDIQTIVTNDYFYDSNDENITIEFDKEINKKVYSIQDLEHAKKVSIDLKKDTDLSFLNYTPNLEELTIKVNGYTNSLKTIDGNSFNNPLDITLIPGTISNSYFIENDYSFLKNINSINKLTLGTNNSTYMIDYDFLSTLKNISTLKLSIDSFSNVEANKISFVDKLEIDGEIYDIPISLSKNDIEYLKNNTQLVLENESQIKEINDRLEAIALSFNVSKNSSEKEKINAILEYILKEYEYPKGEIEHENYYNQGHLFGSLEGNKQICGNYSAMVKALSNYLGLETYIIRSNTHSWNIVKVNDEYYYADATWIDGKVIDVDYEIERKTELIDPNHPNSPITQTQITNKATVEEVFNYNDTNTINNLKWYLKNIQDTNDEHHIPMRYIPNVFQDEAINVDENVIDITNNKYIVIFNNRKYVADAISLLSILALFGDAIFIGSLALKQEKTR